MRLSKLLGALGASMTLAVCGQNSAPAQQPAGNQDAAREDLRKALNQDGKAPASQPAKAATPAPVQTSAAPTSAAPALRGTLEEMYPASNILHTANGTVVRLNLEQAILIALENNLEIQVQRYYPLIAEYNWRALYGAYDPVLSANYGQGYTKRESGGFNQNTGNPFPATKTDTETFGAGLSGYLPYTGLRYEIGNDNVNTRASRPVQIGTNSFGQPVYAKQVTDTWSSGAALTVTQPLLKDFWIDSPRLQMKLMKRDLTISHLELERLAMDVINRVEKAYYTLIANRELVRVGEADVAVKKQFYEEQQRRVQVGTIAPLDEKLAQSELALSEINLITARKNAIDAETLLKGLIQNNYLRQLDVNLELSDKMLAIPANLETYEAFKEAVEKRPDLQSERIKLEKQQIQLKFDRNQLYPSLDIFATWGANGLDRSLGNAWDDISGRRYPQDSWGLRLSVPLTQKNAREKYKAAEAAKEQQILNLKKLEETIVQDVDFQIRQLRTYWNTIPLRREQTTYQQAALEAEQKKLAAGKSTTFEVLKIASGLTQAQSDEIGTLRDYNQALSELAFRKGTTLERWHIDSPLRSPR